MYINKKEQELFAYFLSLNFDDCEIKTTKETMLKALIKLQQKKVFGQVKMYKED